MSQKLFNYKQEGELKKEVHELIKKGLTFPPIKSALENKFDYIRDKSSQQVIDFIDELINNFKGYPFIQRTKNSIVISPNNSRLWFLYNMITKAKEYVQESNIVKLCLFDWKANLLPCALSYLPHTKEDIILNDDGTSIFNTYQPPAWYKEYHYFGKTLEKVSILPAVYADFFTHLFKADKDSTEYVLDWMANALTSKNQCYLTAISLQGTGKGTLGEIFKALVGDVNYVTMPFTSITKQFNSQLEEKKLIYFDEVKVKTREQEDILKILVNDFIEVERKHNDAKTVQNFASLYLSSNDLASLKITGDDRRYSIVEMWNDPSFIGHG